MATNVGARELRRAPGVGVWFRQQAWLLNLSGRWVVLLLGLLTLLLLIGLSDLPGAVPATLIAAVVVLLGGVIWPIMVWHGEGPKRRSYHWSLPVPRPAHDLARVTVGALYLLLICVALAGAGAIVALVDGTFDPFVAMAPETWANLFGGPLIVYLLVMPIVLWSEYPIIRWVFGFWMGLASLNLFLMWQGIDVVADGMTLFFFAKGWGLGPALFDGILRALSQPAGGTNPDPVEFWTAASLWLAVGVALTTFTALFRPDDLRRLVSREQRRR